MHAHVPVCTHVNANFCMFAAPLYSRIFVTFSGCTALCRGINTNCTLQTLSLQYCGLTHSSSASLVAYLASPQNALQSLNLQGNRIGAIGLAALAAAARSSRTLAELTLTDNCIGLSGMLRQSETGEQAAAAAAAAAAPALAQLIMCTSMDAADAAPLPPPRLDFARIWLFSQWPATGGSYYCGRITGPVPYSS